MLIVERLTPVGTGALAVLRLRGAELPPLLTDRQGRRLPWPRTGETLLACVCEGSRRLDQAVVWARADGAELHLHGGEAGVQAVTALCQAHGAELRVRDPGMVPASLAAARALSSAQHGPLAQLARDARNALGRGLLPAALAPRLDRALSLATLGRHLAKPPRVRLVGLPNAGKSTLFNALLGRRRALVSPQPGTTRDTVTATVSLCGIPAVLEDSAGAQPGPAPTDPSRQSPPELELHLLSSPDETARSGPSVLVVQGRIDEQARVQGGPWHAGVSGLTGQGVGELERRLAQRLGLTADPEDHAWAPMSPALLELLARARALGSG